MSFELVIFDCDGVLVDSEAMSSRAHAELLTRHGYPITPEEVLRRFLGVSDREARLIVERELGRTLPHDFDEQVKQATLRDSGDPLPIAHIDKAIAAIALPKCVASSGTPDKIRHGLTCAGLYDVLTPHLFSAVEVERGKPAPDLFLFAAERMNVVPERCIVIEDSVPGVKGAIAAGMTVLGFHGGSHCRDGHAELLRAAGAIATFEDMRQLPALIGQIGVMAAAD